MLVSHTFVRESWASFLESYNFKLFGTFTFRPKTSTIVTPKYAIGRFKRLMRDLDCGQWFAVAEDNPFKEDVHLHALFDSNKKLSSLERSWKHGISSISHTTAKSASYCSKQLYGGSEFDFAPDIKSLLDNEMMI